MAKQYISIIAGTALATLLWGCEVNIENPGVDGDAGMSENNVNGDTNNANNNGGDTGNNNNNNNNNGDAGNNNQEDLGTDDMGNPIANEVYPCADMPEIPADQCQGGWEWDDYEDQELIDRGQYLVRHVAACTDCHMPATPDFTPKQSCLDDGAFWSIRDCDKELAGWNFPFLDYSAVDGVGAVGIPNITPHPDGIGEWGPEDLRLAFTKGIRPEDTDKPRLIFPLMPYWVYHHFTQDDQDAIIAYLHSLDPIPSGEPPAGPYERESQAADSPLRLLDLAEPADIDGDGELDGIAPTPDDFMPAITLDAGDPDFEKAERGKYLAQVACSYCHTPAYEPDAGWDPEDIVNQYTYVDHEAANCGSDQDGAIIYSSWWPGSALYGPAFPDEIHAQNITGHMTFGVGDYTIDELIRSVNGTDKENELMCPPMYVDTWFAEMTAEDKEAIAIYLQNSAPCDNDTEGMGFDCRLPE